MPDAASQLVAPVQRAFPGGLDEAALRRVFAGKHVLLTGHSGFKGSWMALWLRRLGARVTGIALPPQAPSMHAAVGLTHLLDERFADIGVKADYDTAVEGIDADILFHMAAQAIVGQSFVDPVETFLTNAVGTAVVLESARRMPSLKAIVIVTSDKCYENREWDWGYRETDALGGSDPYSASKACTELVAASFRRSFFKDAGAPRLATVRAGNVIGGGDWATGRLVPDLMRAALSGCPAFIRNPHSVRPWQHVLEPLAGYLMVAARLVEDGDTAVGGWNFGPDPGVQIPAGALAEMVMQAWGQGAPPLRFGSEASGPREAGRLALDSSKARAQLGWRPRLDIGAALALTTEWFRAWADETTDMAAFSEAQIAAYALGGTTQDHLEQGAMKQCA